MQSSYQYLEGSLYSDGVLPWSSNTPWCIITQHRQHPSLVLGTIKGDLNNRCNSSVSNWWSRDGRSLHGCTACQLHTYPGYAVIVYFLLLSICVNSCESGKYLNVHLYFPHKQVDLIKQRRKGYTQLNHSYWLLIYSITVPKHTMILLTQATRPSYK